MLASGSVMRARELPRELERHPAHRGDRRGLVLRGGSAIIAPICAYIAGPRIRGSDFAVADIDRDTLGASK